MTETAEYLLADRRPGWKVKLVQVLDPVHKLLHFLSTDSGEGHHEYLLAEHRPGWKVKLVQVMDPVHKLLHFLNTDSGDRDI